jgi:hypothetical protein
MPAYLGWRLDMGSLANGRGTFSLLRQRVFVCPNISDIPFLLFSNVRETSDIDHRQLGNADFANGLLKRWRLQRFPQRTCVPDSLDLPILQPFVSQLSMALDWDGADCCAFNAVYPPTLSS